MVDSARPRRLLIIKSETISRTCNQKASAEAGCKMYQGTGKTCIALAWDGVGITMWVSGRHTAEYMEAFTDLSHARGNSSIQVEKGNKISIIGKDIVYVYTLIRVACRIVCTVTSTTALPDLIVATGKMGERGITFKDGFHEWELTDLYLESPNWDLTFIVQVKKTLI